MPDEINLNDLNSREDYKKKIRKKIGNNIRKYRKACNLNQDQLAELLGCTCGQISFIERGERNPQLYFLYQIAYILGVSIGDLLSINNSHDDSIYSIEVPRDQSMEYTNEDNNPVKAKKDVVYNLIDNCNDSEVIDLLIAALKIFNNNIKVED